MNHTKLLLLKMLIFTLLLFIGISSLPVAEAEEDCISCHPIDINAMSAGIHGNINNASISDIFPACNSCHVDGSTRTCEYCHVKELEATTFNNTTIITEHRSNADDIKTDASCVVCHINSVNSSPAFNSDYQRVAHYGTTTNLMTSVNRSVDCKWCHFTNSGNISWGAPADPRSLPSIDHTKFVSSNVTSNQECYGCHSDESIPDNFHNASLNIKAGGKDCVLCHEIEVLTGQLFGIDVSAMNTSKNIHYNLNRRAIATTTLNPDNVRCWACHGDGDGTAASQPDVHPVNYKTPKNCNNNDCHTLNQSIFNEPMIYGHFESAELLNNTDEDASTPISTIITCEICHINNIIYNRDDVMSFNITDIDTYSVSHYGSIENLVTPSNCIYCHIEEGNDEDFGDAPSPNDKISPFSDNKVEKTIQYGKIWNIGSGYTLTLDGISLNGKSALTTLKYDNKIIDEMVFSRGDSYDYHIDVKDTDDNIRTINITSFNVTQVFSEGVGKGAIKLEGYKWKRIHNESTNEGCYTCHTNDYLVKTNQYTIIDRDSDDTYYTELYADFNDESSPEVKIMELTDDSLYSNNSWHIGEYIFTIEEIDIDGGQALLSLEIAGIEVDKNILNVGEVYEYDTDLTINNHTIEDIIFFSARLDYIFVGLQSNSAVFTDVKIISPNLDHIENDEYIGGYNSSWLRINDTFNIGGVPQSLHSPALFIGAVTGSDCLLCHSATSPVSAQVIDTTDTGLGVHNTLNADEKSADILAHNISKACWACHGDGAEPPEHCEDIPKECNDCHRTGRFDAIDLSGVPHGIGTVCQSCHGTTHNVQPLAARATIRNYEILDNDVVKGETLNLSVIASAGWGMNIEAVEYFIDHVGNGTLIGIGMIAQDGAFDSQVESAHATIDTASMEYGSHTIYVRAKERNRWGNFKEIKINVVRPNGLNTILPGNFFKFYIKPALFTLLTLTIFVLAYRLFRRHSKHGGL